MEYEINCGVSNSDIDVLLAVINYFYYHYFRQFVYWSKTLTISRSLFDNGHP